MPPPNERPPVPGTIEPPTPIERLRNTEWTRPTISLPLPSLRFLFRLEFDMDKFRSIGPGPHGDRKNVIFKGGRFEGPNIRGKLIPGGGDWEVVQDHDEDQQTAYLDTRYNLETHDGAVIYLQTTGTRTGVRDVLEKLGEGEIGPEEYRMRLHLTFETGDPRYSWINTGVFVASAARSGDQVIYDAYQMF